MWVHPDLLDDEQWTAQPSKEAKRKYCNVVTAILDTDDAAMTALTDSEEDTNVFATRAGKEFAKQYPARTENPAGPPARPAAAVPPNPDEPSSNRQPYRFNVLAQLKSIPARITVYDLLRLSRPTREALQEALADAEAFSTHFSKETEIEQGCTTCCQVSERQIHCTTFTPEDMLIKNTFFHDASKDR
ncbi:uncharacterized protein A4U43_C01F11940 [Asparagus officinalis]|uniref:Uncharacterized protein n=1 Tax=Asparagus officinalis TaxID=4686 RepID=A0A5P1FSF8_ASPOF|nr:uncharacterized protein A4U43_C01F11940 [Asparagus officinalis]